MRLAHFLLILSFLCGCLASHLGAADTVAPKPMPASAAWVDLVPPTFGLMQDGIFLSPRIGLMTGDKTWRTSDGGRTWVEDPAWQGRAGFRQSGSQLSAAASVGWRSGP